MKNKLTALASIVLMLMAAFFASVIDVQKKDNRYHQHLEVAAQNFQPSGEQCSHAATQLCTYLPIVSIDLFGN